MSSQSWLYLIIGIVVFDYVFEQILDLLNIRAKKTEIPSAVQDYYDAEKYSKALAYQRTNTRFGFLTSFISISVSLIMLFSGGFGLIDQWLRPYFSSEILLGLVYFFTLFIASDILTLPVQWYRTFVIEEKFGFNTTTVKTFIIDKLKGYVLTVIVGGLIGGALFWLILQIGPDFWIYFLLVVVAVMLFIQYFYATLILPLFNTLTPLEDGELRSAITDYAKGMDFPLTHIFVIDGSKRSKKANAFFMGLGKKKKIVLYDTLIQNHSTEELVAVLAHEMGHYKKKHIISGMLLSVIQVAFTLYILSLFVFNDSLSAALGGNQLGIHLNLIAFSILFSPISKVTGTFMNILSRKNEFEADAFAKETYQANHLTTALKKLSVDNLSNLYPHPAVVFFHYSHPPLLQRLTALES